MGWTTSAVTEYVTPSSMPSSIAIEPPSGSHRMPSIGAVVDRGGYGIGSHGRSRSPVVVNVTSVVGLTGNPGQANYAASKAGLVGFTKAVAREVASRSITVNAVAPGYIETDMTAAMSDKAREAITGAVPLGRVGTADDVAAAVAFLVSDGAAYITGQVLNVNGGLI